MATTALAQEHATPPAFAGKVDAILDQYTSSGEITGAVVMVAIDGRLIYARAAGFADRESQTAMSANSIFRLASMTKPLTSAAALALVEEGKLSLDNTVSKFLPGFAPRGPDGRQPEITIRQLLTHTAGLDYGFLQNSEDPNSPYNQAGISDGVQNTPGLTLQENARRIGTSRLLYEPGTQWRYSIAIDLLGAVLEKVERQPLQQIIERTVTSKLGMTETRFTPTDPARLVTAYAPGKPAIRMGARQVVKQDGGVFIFAPGRNLDPNAFPSGGAGMVGTADEYLLFLETLRKGGGSLLHPATVKAMTSPAIGAIPTSDAGWSFGYGFAVLVDPVAAKSPLHKGAFRWGGVYGNDFWVDPVSKTSVVIMSNTALTGSSGPFPKAILQAIHDAEEARAAADAAAAAMPVEVMAAPVKRVETRGKENWKPVATGGEREMENPEVAAPPTAGGPTTEMTPVP